MTVVGRKKKSLNGVQLTLKEGKGAFFSRMAKMMSKLGLQKAVKM